MTSAANATVRLELDGAFAELVLDRPDKMNAVNEAMVADLHECLARVEEAGTRALVVRGEGRGFCAGRDLADADPANGLDSPRSRGAHFGAPYGMSIANSQRPSF